jgi:hypothetical protein
MSYFVQNWQFIGATAGGGEYIRIRWQSHAHPLTKTCASVAEDMRMCWVAHTHQKMVLFFKKLKME